MGHVEILVQGGDAGERLDRWLARSIEDLSRSRARMLVQAGDVSIDGVVTTRPSAAVVAGQQIEVRVRSRPAGHSAVPEQLPLSVLYEDDQLAVLDKAAGMVVHPGAGNATGTLVNALLFHFGDRMRGVADASRPGIVHRLDKGTSGVIVVAFTDTAHARLQEQFARRTVRKEYLALAYGRLEGSIGTIDVPLGRDRADRKRISANTARARASRTDWQLLESLSGMSWVRAQPRTGRTHQIRAHFTHIGHPLVGDDTYAGRRWRGIGDAALASAVRQLGRPALHAAALEFEHPVSRTQQRYEAPLPPDLRAVLEAARAAVERSIGRS